MAKEQVKTAEVTKAYGKPLSEYGAPASIVVEFKYDAFENLDEVPADDRLSPEDELAVINARRNAASRAAAVNAALAEYDIKAPALSDAEKAENGMVKALTLMGTPEDEARQMVKAMLANTPKGRS